MASKDKGELLGGKRSSNGQSAEVRDQLELESGWRGRLGVPALAGGFLYLIGTVIIGSAISGAPTVGLLQAISPALKGEAQPARSPRADEVIYISHHAFGLIAGSLVSAVSLLALTAVLFVLVKATRFRRPVSWPATLPLVLIGGFGFAAVSIGHQIAGAILTHDFAVGHDFSNHAVDYALTNAGVNVAMQYISLLAGLSLTVGMISANLGAMRSGLLTRWMGVVGIFAALLVFLPIGGETLSLVPAFWLAGMGLLYMGRWPGEEPPAWAAGESRPWPSQAEMRAAAKAASGQNIDAAPAIENGSGAGADLTPAAATGRRRRKRGSRG
ncbi:MAG TPA: hypothetical protein VGP17_11075 [Solirubrobacteraceae bacterium]|jgi:hypothetical protein|nr:hypothetical protein [Solirubrobacteraceae bacterium]